MNSIHRALLALVLGFAIAVPASATLVPVEEAVETVALDIRLNDDLTGTVSGRSCDDCRRRSFAITPETQAIENRTRVDLRRALEQRGRPATILYNIRSGKATKIIWWQ